MEFLVLLGEDILEGWLVGKGVVESPAAEIGARGGHVPEDDRVVGEDLVGGDADR